jgi:WD40 repeat protein
MLTASGDQCVHLWDTSTARGLGQFRGHNGSVKSVCPHPHTAPIFASGTTFWNPGASSYLDPVTSVLKSGLEISGMRMSDAPDPCYTLHSKRGSLMPHQIPFVECHASHLMLPFS